MGKISKLCLNCPNFNENWPDEGQGNCKGYYNRDEEGACLTFKSWRGGKLTYEEALSAKNRQHSRHQKTDKFREDIRRRILHYQGEVSKRFIKKQANEVATRIAKGENAFSVFEEAQERTNLYLPRKLSIAIEEDRRRFVQS